MREFVRITVSLSTAINRGSAVCDLIRVTAIDLAVHHGDNSNKAYPKGITSDFLRFHSMLTYKGAHRTTEAGTTRCHHRYILLSCKLYNAADAIAPISDDNLLEWKGTILGPQNTPYKV